MKKNQTIYKGLGELNNSAEFEDNKHNEFPEKLPTMEQMGSDIEGMKAPRRDFLKLMGFSLTAATVAASCEMPVRKAIPYLNKPEEITPGVANWYASSYISGGDYASILVKNREGRPIKIEGNTASEVTKGGTSARVQASVLSLYDGSRLQNPLIKGEKSDWNKLDAAVSAELSKEGKVVVLSPSIISPSTQGVINDFVGSRENTVHVKYDAVSASGMVNANELSFGKAAIPAYHFDKAEVIVSFDADFLGDWISPIEFTKQYTKNRKVSKNKTGMSRHFQFEGVMSMTGTNADRRVLMAPSEEGAYVGTLYNEIANLTGAEKVKTASPENMDEVKKVAKELWAKKGYGLVISGSNDTNIQVLINAINYLLGNYGSTLDIANHANYRQAKDADFTQLVHDMLQGNVAGVILYDANPVYTSSLGGKFAEGLAKCSFSVSLNEREDESTELVTYAAPNNFYLESWGDAEPVVGQFSLMQPVIHPLFNTRQAQDSLLKWSGSSVSFYNYIRTYWNANVGGNWDECLHNGVYSKGLSAVETPVFFGDVKAVASAIKVEKGDFDLKLYTKVGMGDGKYANNPWQQELPDPVTKATWDNYILINAADAEAKGVVTEDMVNITSNGITIEMPVLVQPGQKKGVLGIALGYGRKNAGKGSNIGRNLYPMLNYNGMDMLFNGVASLVKTEGQYALAMNQEHHHINPQKRPIIREATLANYVNDPYAGYTKVNDDGVIIKSGEDEFKRLARVRTEVLYDDPKFTGHHWGMSVDMNACTGCGACIVSCSAENNVPVVGKYEMKRRHDMHWMRIDRYYISSASNHEDDAIENPRVVHQPMMCQHCDNAPCENVCPVAATNHSSEGLNQMAYNRCVGTRYCENNCPYKVRRFNWYDYTGQDSFAWNEHIHESISNEAGDDIDDLVKMVLNPDVTIRSRGVIEKCSFCVQRIQEGKLTAKKERRPLRDGDVKSACQTACPADAIVFGDLLDKESKVSKSFAEERNYHVLDEIHVLPSVGYLTKVRNISQDELNKA